MSDYSDKAHYRWREKVVAVVREWLEMHQMDDAERFDDVIDELLDKLEPLLAERD